MNLIRRGPAAACMYALFAMFALLLGACADNRAFAQAQPQQPPKLDVPYVPTPPEIVNKMLDMGQVGKDDVVYDLGCGDGRIVITAAKERGARGTGVDINPQRIKEAQANAREAGVEDRVNFKVGDLFATNFSEASVVTLYLLPDVNRRLRPELWRQLKVGTRVVSHDFDMGEDWPPEKVEKIGNKTIYLWTITKANKAAARSPTGKASLDARPAGPRS